jgi:hypothetical protein
MTNVNYIAITAFIRLHICTIKRMLRSRSPPPIKNRKRATVLQLVVHVNEEYYTPNRARFFLRKKYIELLALIES